MQPKRTMNIRPGILLGALFLLYCHPVSPAYSNLIATSDGSVVLVEVRTGIRTTQWYKVTLESGRPAVGLDDRPVADISEDSTVVASSFYGARYCGFSGSTCWLARPCRAEFAVEGPAVQVEGTDRPTLIRLNRSGRIAWIEQSGECRFMNAQLPPELQGLYELPGLRLIAPAGGATLANKRPGRRLITNRDQVLTFGGAANIQLQLLDETGSRPIRHVAGAAEAVIDAEGRNVVYTDAPLGRLRWIDIALQTDEDLVLIPTIGAAPALSDDGALLVFLSPEGRLQLYRRQLRTVETIEGDDGPVREFALSGDGRFIFAVTAAGRLIRVELTSGKLETWLEPLPEIEDTSAELSDWRGCHYICYGQFDPLMLLGRSSLVVLQGRNLNQPGWQVRLGDVVVPVHPFNDDAVWLQVPADLPNGENTEFRIFHPEHPLEGNIPARVHDRHLTCFGALHRDFDRIVTETDPARVGDIVHIFLTGLQGVEPVPDGVANPMDRLIPVDSPPAFASDGVLEPLFFGLAPGFVGLQQLDARILRHVQRLPGEAPPQLFHYTVSSSGCELPPSAP